MKKMTLLSFLKIKLKLKKISKLHWKYIFEVNQEVIEGLRVVKK